MDIEQLLETTLNGLGYELVDIEISQHNRKRLIRLFIDKAGGVNIDDCAYVSNHVSRLLAVEMDYDYDRLEVSSPGLDRPLRKEADFLRFTGETVQLKTRVPLEGRRKFVGRLAGLADGRIQMDVDGRMVAIDMDNLDKARLVPKF